MSMLRRGDEALHYSDHSHRWIAPPDVEQAEWEADLRTHLSQHRTTMGGPSHMDAPVCLPRRVQRPAAPARPAARRNGNVVPVPELPRHVKDRSARPAA
jgi:hypothetical protein